MTDRQRKGLEKLSATPSAETDGWEDVDVDPCEEVSMIEAVLAGDIEAPTSNAGGELHEELCSRSEEGNTIIINSSENMLHFVDGRYPFKTI